MNFKNILTSIIIILCCSQVSFGQSSAQLKKQLERINSEISALNKELAQKTKEKLLSQREVAALSKQISLREEKITVISREVNFLTNQINTNKKAVEERTAELAKLRKDYEKMILFAFRNKNAYNKMMFIFASKDFNQAFKRVKYLQQFSDAREVKSAEIEKVKKDIELKIAQMEVDRNTQRELLKVQQEERSIIAKDRSQHQSQLNSIVKEERTYKGQLSKKQQERKKVEGMIKAAIQREIVEERKRAEAERKRLAEAEAKRTGKTVAEVEKVTPKKSDSEILRSTPEAAKLSADFKSNRGRLPWPVSQGNIIRDFGPYTIEGVRSMSEEVAIKTSSGAGVRAVFDGQVVQSVAGTVVVKHGEYFTFYSNLSSVSVHRGQKVSRGQQVGTAGHDSEFDAPVVYFGVMQGMTANNPSSWLAR